VGGCLQGRVILVWELDGAVRHADVVVRSVSAEV
jgi:hypothetical protein